MRQLKISTISARTLHEKIRKLPCAWATGSWTTLRFWPSFLSSVRPIPEEHRGQCGKLSFALVGSSMMYPKNRAQWKSSMFRHWRMISARNRWLVWVALFIAAALAAAYSFLNFWAAADLGYDTSPRGRSILAGWTYAVWGCVAAAIGLAVLAGRSWWSTRKPIHPGGEHNEKSAGWLQVSV